MPILLHALVATGYAAVATAIWRSASQRRGIGLDAANRSPLRLATGLRAGIVAVWVVHAWLLRDAALFDGAWRFGFALALSATMWLAVALFWAESFVVSLGSVWLVLLPLAALCALLPVAFHGSVVLGQMSGADGDGFSPWLVVHLAVALAAYGLLTIAAVHALFMAALDRWLHRARGNAWGGGSNDAVPRDEHGSTGRADDGRGARIEETLLGPLPPLLTMEKILFRLIGAGFVLLTLTVLSGVVFSEALFGKPIRFDHKTIFTLIAWATFGALLIGRVARGWRGRLALSWTLGGFAMLFLAYAGSRFVLEVVLHRV